MLTGVQEFPYHKIENHSFGDYVSPLVILGVVLGLMLIAFGVILLRQKSIKQDYRRFGDAPMLFVFAATFFMLAGLGSITALDTAQGKVDAETIAKDYGVDVDSVSEFLESDDAPDVIMSEVSLRIDGELTECRQYVYTETNMYSVSCSQDFPLESLT